MNVERRFLTESGTEIFTGNELLVKGALETEGGVHLLGGYPGSPIAGYFDSLSLLKDLLDENGIRAVINNNEALSAAMLNGTQAMPTRAMIVMKSVGVHVAADALALGAQAGSHPEGGAIVVYGDDPWCDSTQVPADSRYLSKHLFIPVIEPSNPQEVKDFVDLSFKLGARCELYAGFVLTNNLADGGGSVLCKPNQFPRYNVLNRFNFRTQDINLDKRVLLPPKTWWQEESMPARLAKAVDTARELGLNKIEFPRAEGKAPLGFVSAGLGHNYLIHALSEMGLHNRYPILKLGMSYPMDRTLLNELAEQCESIVVVEERRGFMEEQINELAGRARNAEEPLGRVPVYGKQFPYGLEGIPSTRGLHPSMLIKQLGPLLQRLTPAEQRDNLGTLRTELDDLARTETIETAKLPTRLASFCPGCPHRDTASLCLEIQRNFRNPHYMKTLDHDPVDLIFHGDTGCYTMLLFPPNTSLMHDYSGMGLGAGTGSGTDKFTPNKEVVFMGDSTFFHSGQIAISQAIKLDQDITFIILDNSTTAMTGHQPTPGVDYDLLGNETAKQDIEEVVRGMVGSLDVPVMRFDPEQRLAYRDLLEKTFLADGVKVIIATKECGITRSRRHKREQRQIIKDKGFLPIWKHMNVNSEICRFCLACTELTGCPGLRHVETEYGRKIDTDVSWCVADGACERVGACDAFERVTITRNKPPKTRVPELDLDNIPEPDKRPAGEIWQGVLTGVGGMGIGLATSILVRAGHREGYDVVFLDKKGLAIRNGAVVSQVTYNIAKLPVTSSIPYGKADLLLGVDILEAARLFDPAHRMRVVSKQRTAAVINTDKIATIRGLMGQEDYDPDQLADFIRTHTCEDLFLARNISRICEKYLGSKIYANIMMMGYAFQRGLIPVSMHSIAWAIKDAIRVNFRKNLYAFNMGRKLYADPTLFLGPPQRTGWKDTLDEKCRFAHRRHGKNNPTVDEFRRRTAGAIETMDALDETAKRDIVVRGYDCFRWGGVAYAEDYLKGVLSVYRQDRPEYEYAATAAVIENLAAAMLIKDSIFKAELSTSPEKYARDREKYNINPANGDQIAYRHLWKRSLTLGAWRKRLDIPVFDWQLQVLKRMRWLRPLLGASSRVDRKRREDYQQHVRSFTYDSADEYRRKLALLASPYCMHCYSPSCKEAGCPLANDVPEWMKLVDEGNWKQAAALLHERNNFPEFTARICPAFCEQACKQGVQASPVSVRVTEGEIVERAFADGWITPQPAETASGKRVAVIGSGPAGLTAAQQLARAGHAVTVFEKDDAPGGLLRYGVPEFRLPKDLLDRRLSQLRAEGVEFRCRAGVGSDVSGEEILREFDTVLLAAGARKAKDLPVPGREQAGVVFAMDYLTDTAPDRKTPLDVRDKTVAVIGGGLTGEDCVETALHAGAKQVVQLEILPKPRTQAGLASPDEMDRVQQYHSVATRQFRGNGSLQELEAVRIRYTPSPKGPIAEEIRDSAFRIPADVAILAVGFDAVVDRALAKQLGLATDEHGKPHVNEYCETNVEGVFAAGDLVTGPSYVATAIASGQRAAEQIHNYLRSK